MNENITYTKASGAELERLINAMERVLVGEREQHIVMACLALVISLQVPDITSEQLAKGVKGASEWIALFGSSLNLDSHPEQVN